MSMMSMEDVVYDMDQYVNLSENALYSMIQTRQARKVLLDKYKSNPQLWSSTFASTVKRAQNRFQRSGLASTFHGLRILIQRQTLYAIQNGHYEISDGAKISIHSKDIIHSAKQTKYYSSQAISDIASAKPQSDQKEKNHATEIDVLNTDCLDAAHSLLCDDYNPCLLNMANAHSAGGGYSSGMGAQEENLCRRTTLITALVNCVESKKKLLDKHRKWKYPIDTFGAIYVPQVSVLRSSEHLGYDFLAKPYKMDIITAAMLSRPGYNKDFDYIHKSKAKIREKLKSVLRVAYDNGHDACVLSSWGCGAFKNPPLGQAKLWKDILLHDEEFQGKFKKIVFAIFDDHNAGKEHNPFGNFLPFMQTFDITEKRIKEFVNEIGCEEKNSGAMDVFNALDAILAKITENRDLEYDVVNAQLDYNITAMNILYCAGFKRSSDGSRLQIENKRINIAINVHTELLKHKKN